MQLELFSSDPKDVSLIVYPDLKLADDQPGPRVEFKYCFLNWTDPAQSKHQKDVILYPSDEGFCENKLLLSADPDEILSFLDERGCLYVLLEEIKVLSIETPQT